MKKFDIKNLAEALYETTEGKSGEDQKKVIHAALLMLKQNGMLGKSDELISEMEKIHDLNNNIVRIDLTSKNKLTEKESKEVTDFIKEKYNAKHVEINEKLDDTVLGGVKMKVRDTLYDGTLRTKLKNLETYLIG